MDETNPAANVCMVFAVLSTVALSFKRKKNRVNFHFIKKDIFWPKVPGT